MTKKVIKNNSNKLTKKKYTKMSNSIEIVKKINNLKKLNLEESTILRMIKEEYINKLK